MIAEASMPRIGMEPIRTANLLKATIEEIGDKGSLDITVNQIAKRAGVSSALAHHYFGSKEQLLLSAMRHILTKFGEHVRSELGRATTPRERLEAIIRANFALSFKKNVISAWLNFYVQAQKSEDAMRLLRVYQNRLRSNLLHALRPLFDGDPERAAEGLASMIDGVYIREGLGSSPPNSERAASLVIDYLDCILNKPE